MENTDNQETPGHDQETILIPGWNLQFGNICLIHHLDWKKCQVEANTVADLSITNQH